MDRESTLYALVHYAILLVLIFGVLGGLELVGGEIPFWIGLIIALAIGILYPSIVRGMGVAPKHWE